MLNPRPNEGKLKMNACVSRRDRNISGRAFYLCRARADRIGIDPAASESMAFLRAAGRHGGMRNVVFAGAASDGGGVVYALERPGSGVVLLSRVITAGPGVVQQLDPGDRGGDNFGKSEPAQYGCGRVLTGVFRGNRRLSEFLAGEVPAQRDPDGCGSRKSGGDHIGDRGKFWFGSQSQGKGESLA